MALRVSALIHQATENRSLTITYVYRYKDEEEVALILKNYEQNLKEAKKIFFDHVEKVDLAKEVTALILIALVVLFSWLVVWGREVKGPLRQYFSLDWAVSKIGEWKD